MSDLPEKIYALPQQVWLYEKWEVPEEVEYTRSGLCIPLPTLPDEMELDGGGVYVVHEWGSSSKWRLVVYMSMGKEWVEYRVQIAHHTRPDVWSDSSQPVEPITRLLQLPELEVQGNKIRRKG